MVSISRCRGSASACFRLNAPAGASILVGSAKTPVTQPFRLDTLGTCAPPLGEISIGNASAQETDANATFTVSLSAASEFTVSADYATSNGTAVGGQDYKSVTGSVTFTPGQTSKTLPVALFDDAVAEGYETFTLNLSNAKNATLSFTAGTATGTIIDNDISSCGAPNYNSGVTRAVLVWRDCATGQWFARFSSGGASSTINYTGSVTAGNPFSAVQLFSVEANDTVNYTANTSIITYDLHVPAAPWMGSISSRRRYRPVSE